MAGLSTYGKSGNLNSGKGTVAQAKNSIKADISAARKLATQSRRKGFKYTTDVNAAIYGNLATTVAGYGRSLTGEQARQLQALRALQANTAAREAGLAAGAAGVVRSQYGSAIAGAVRPATRGLQVLAKAATKTVNAQVGAAGIVARGNEAAQATLGQGVATAQASAQYATAQALEYRAKNDAQATATAKLALDQMILANKLDIANYKAKLALDEKAAGGDTAGVTAVATAGANAAAGLNASYNTYYAQDGSTYRTDEVFYDEDTGKLYADEDHTIPVTLPNATQAASAYVSENAITDENQVKMIYAVSQAMYAAGAGKAPGAFENRSETVTAAVNQQLAILYPQYAKKHGADMAGLVGATVSFDTYTRGPQKEPGSPGILGTVAGVIVRAPISGLWAAAYGISNLVDALNGGDGGVHWDAILKAKQMKADGVSESKITAYLKSQGVIGEI